MNSIQFYIKWLVLFLLLLGLLSCSQVMLKIDEVPANTPKGTAIYVTGNFNRWDPGDPRFQLDLNADGTYSVQLPQTFGNVEYKFTRGDWTTVETDRCGNQTENRFFSGRTRDTLSHFIESWNDLDPLNCDSVTIVVTQIPANTPNNDTIRIAGSFNAWNPGVNAAYILKKDEIKNWYKVTVPRISWSGNASGLLTYKFIRNDLNEAEADKFGREMEPRILDFRRGDSVFVTIDNWIDLADPNLSHVTFILKSVPDNTPANDPVYLVGNFNNWNPGDKKYRFKKNSEGLFQLSIPRERYGLSFKITRGSWESEFADACGNKLPNQDYNYDEVDTLYIKVESWFDLRKQINPYVNLIIDEIPANTPENAELYLDYFEFFAGEKQPGFTFTQDGSGKYTLKVKRSKLIGGYVVTRGSHFTQEVDAQGNFLSPRYFQDACSDTIYMKVAAWNDTFSSSETMISLNIDAYPKSTPMGDKLYLTGLFNGWNPGDDNFAFTKDKRGTYTIQVPLRWLASGFKITRGSWRTGEAKSNGNFVPNRYYTGQAKELVIEIKGWEDK